MMRTSKLAGLLAALLLALVYAVPAQAQATRTWVSGVGDDANPCSRTAPCKTFAGAVSKTAAGGEIDVLDPGGFGTLTITKSITIDGGGGIGGQVASVLNSSGIPGFTVNAATTDKIKLRNLTIDGAGPTLGTYGIRFIAGGFLIVEHVGIFSQSLEGVDFEPTTTGAHLTMLDVEVQYGSGDGILVKPSGSGTALVQVARVSALDNVGSGLRVDSTGLTSGTGSVVTAVDCIFNGGQFGALALTPAGTKPASLALVRDTISNNSSGGVVANGTATFVTLTGSAVTGNATGVGAINGGTLKSFGDNAFSINAVDGTPTPPNLSKL